MWQSVKRGTQNFFFLHNKATNTFCIEHEKNGIVVPKRVLRADILQTKFTTSGGCNISSTYLASFLVHSMSIITPTCTPYLLLRKQSEEDKNILWMMRMIFERHPCCCGTTMQWSVSVSSVYLVGLESTLTNLSFTLASHRPFLLLKCTHTWFGDFFVLWIVITNFVKFSFLKKKLEKKRCFFSKRFVFFFLL